MRSASCKMRWLAVACLCRGAVALTLTRRGVARAGCAAAAAALQRPAFAAVDVPVELRAEATLRVASLIPLVEWADAVTAIEKAVVEADGDRATLTAAHSRLVQIIDRKALVRIAAERYIGLTTAVDRPEEALRRIAPIGLATKRCDTLERSLSLAMRGVVPSKPTVGNEAPPTLVQIAALTGRAARTFFESQAVPEDAKEARRLVDVVRKADKDKDGELSAIEEASLSDEDRETLQGAIDALGLRANAKG
ncbi:hypothetical protein M885DRAFT_509551 [Pelagophyceae sp. CCMP2097]|nr:hypothetical protein M885DRAFT_509551 [Pelagophyceae sp. CCMP2097]